MKGSLKGYGLLVFWGGTSFLKNERLIIVTFLTKKKKKDFPHNNQRTTFFRWWVSQKNVFGLKGEKSSLHH